MALCASAGAPLGTLDNLQSAFWQTADGVPNHDVVSIAQTTDGFIWLGTTGSSNSLACFDGSDFLHPFPVADGDEHQHTQLAAGQDGRLWVSKSSSPNSLLLWEHGRASSLELKLPTAGLRGIPLFEDRRGNLWIGGGGLLVREPSGQVRDFDTFAKTFGEVRQITEDREGTIWLATSHGLVRNRQEQFDQPYPVTNGLCSVFASKEGSLWLGTDSQPSLIQVTRKGELVLYSTAKGLDSIGVWSICEDREGAIWLATYSGLYCVRDGEVHLLPETDLRTSFIFSLMWDREGSLWVGTADGLYRLSSKPIRHYGAGDGLGSVSSISIGPSGVWANIFSRGVFLMEGQAWKKRFDIPDSSKDSRLLETARGDLWLATEMNCYHIHDGKTDGLPAVGSLAVFCEDGEGTWIVNSTNLFCFRNGTLERMGDPWPKTEATCAATNGNGGLLIGTTNGLFEWNGKRTQLLALGKDLPGSLINAIDWDGGTLWLATDKAIARRKAQWELIKTDTALPEVGGINCMLVRKGNIWLGTTKGLFQISQSEVAQYLEGKQSQLTLVQYSKDQGMRSGYLGAAKPWGQGAAEGKDDRLWFASKNGVLTVNTIEPMKPNPPPLVIERVWLDQRLAVDFLENSNQVVSLPAGTRNVEIHYAALTYLEPGKVIYKYRLLGLDTNWARVGNSRVARFAKLAPGNYQFEVRARNAAGIWSERGAGVRFVQEPFFYQTPAFKILCAVLCLAFILALIAFATTVSNAIATRKMRRQMELLEARQALDRERARIARDIHDDVGSTLTQIVLLTELANRQPGQTFTPDGYLAGIRSAAWEITRRLDEIVWVVNPRNDRLEALVSYLSKLAADQAKAAGLRCRLKIPPNLPGWPINGSMRHHLFLACKEAIHNALKHASASEIQFCLAFHDEVLVLEICDNGVGMPATKPGSDGEGLGNLQERMADLGGSCEITSNPGQGTIVRFQVPCPGSDKSVSTK